jgi:hypothetical protein
VHVRDVEWPVRQSSPGWTARAPRRSSVLGSPLLRLATTLVGALVGGALCAVVWVSEPVAHAAVSTPTLGTPMRAGLSCLREALAPAIDDEERDDGAQWWKRPTPMEPADAARHLALAWEEVLDERPDSRAIAVLWAQWALETGRGRWMVDYNFAGLKGRAPGGGSALWWTWEETEAGPRRIRSRFRAYAKPEEGARDYIAMLARRYSDAISAARRGDTVGFMDVLERRGYFTEKPAAYSRALSSLAREFAAGDLAKPYPNP